MFAHANELDAITALVTFEVAGVDPAPFVAVTIVSSVCPISPVTGVYVDEVAPLIAALVSA
jgi:hypothetical protein